MAQISHPSTPKSDKYDLAMKIIDAHIRSSRARPELSHIYAFLADNSLRKLYGKDSFLTFCASGFYLELNGERHFKEMPYKIATPALEKNIRSHQITTAFLSTKLVNVLTINLLYANQFINTPKLWIYFFNKYLRNHGVEISLRPAQTIFLGIAPRLTEKSNGYPHKVSVIMTAFQAQETLIKAANSILRQSHKNLELIIVNDGSIDATGVLAERLCSMDHRVRVIHNDRNFGAYVSRNLALRLVSGQYFTCQDADDIAMPQRIEHQLRDLLSSNSTTNTCLMLRMSKSGQITRNSEPNMNSPDGYSRLCHISGLHETAFFKSKIGSWDSVRFGADTELLSRIRLANGAKISLLNSVQYLALDQETSLTRGQQTGLYSSTGRDARNRYSKSWQSWQNNSGVSYLPFPLISRPFEIPSEMALDF